MRIVTKLRKGSRTVSRGAALVLARGSVSLADKSKSASVVLHLTAAGRQRLVHTDRHRPVAAELSLSMPGGKTIVKLVLIT